MPNIIVRADGSAFIGTGHIMRCLALSETLRRLGNIIFVTKDIDPGLISEITNRGYAVETFPPLSELAEDFHFLKSSISKHNAGIVVVDSYDIDSEYLNNLKALGIILLSIDDLGEIDLCSDIVVNQNLSAFDINYKTEDQTKLLLGPSYAILRDEFLSLGPQKKFNDTPKSILVTLGGADPENQTLKVVKALSALDPKIEITVAVGLSYKHLDQLKSAVKNIRPVNILVNSANMSDLMLHADLAVNAGGTTTYELAYMGVPGIILVLADNQRVNAGKLDDNGVSVDLGDHTDVSEQDILNAVNNILADKDKRHLMSDNGKKLVDGKGKQRILEQVEAIL